MDSRSKNPSVELHAHLGSSVDPAMLWSIAHERGIKLPSKNYWDFESMITMDKDEKNLNLNSMHYDFFYWTELIQSSPGPLRESVRSVIGGGYRASNIVLHELRFNPMFRNRGGEMDLDHIIMAAIWGMQQAQLEYPQVKAGLILMMDRMLSFKQNEVILKKAIKYRHLGIVGIDVAGPQRKSFSMKRHAPLFEQARKAGLGITVHTGEEGNIPEMRFVVRQIRPDRIGHGFLCTKDPALMRDIVKQNITLEMCPTSNLKNSVIRNINDLRSIVRKYLQHKIKFTINTDGPEMYRTNIFQEQQLLKKNHILTQAQINQCTQWAFEAAFVK
ncbi:MAG: adenosine deaminase [Candidatus Kerfeldbacteria bacterium]|nr:adenosine deaminase [Candidatus Kerfeldbacteria bacterium]